MKITRLVPGDYDVLVAEYIEELANAGACRMLRASDFEELVTNLVVGCFGELTDGDRDAIYAAVAVALLPVECRSNATIDGETAIKLRDALK